MNIVIVGLLIYGGIVLANWLATETLSGSFVNADNPEISVEFVNRSEFIMHIGEEHVRGTYRISRNNLELNFDLEPGDSFHFFRPIAALSRDRNSFYLDNEWFVRASN